MNSWKSCLLATTIAGFSGPALAQDSAVGSEEVLDLTAYDISTAQFSILGKRRVDLSFSYGTDSQTTIISNGATENLGATLRYTHPVSDRLELSFGISSSSLSSVIAIDGERVGETSNDNTAFTLGARYALFAESANRPEMTASASLSYDGDDVSGDIGLAFVTTSYPAYLFGSGRVLLNEDGYAGLGYNVGVGLSINDELTASVGLNGVLAADAEEGFLGETSYLTTNITYVLDQNWSIDAGVGIGLTEESLGRTVSFGIGYRF